MIRIVIAALLVFGLGVATSAAQDTGRRTSATAASSASASAPINLNTATVAQLETLPGIGKATAERILEYRQKNGSFKKVEEILEKYGSCPDSLSNLTRSPSPAISQSRRKSQQISRRSAHGGRSGGRTRRSARSHLINPATR